MLSLQCVYAETHKPIVFVVRGSSHIVRKKKETAAEHAIVSDVMRGMCRNR
jgi:sarcosine oxidase delta subunit